MHSGFGTLRASCPMNVRATGRRVPMTPPLELDSEVLSTTQLQEHHVTVATALADDLPAVQGDRIALLQVLLNLLANGMDAMERMASRLDLALKEQQIP